MSGVMHLNLTLNNAEKLMFLKEHLNISYTQQISYIFYELSKNDSNELFRIAFESLDRFDRKQLTEQFAVRQDKINLDTFQAIYKTINEKYPDTFEQREFFQLLINYYLNSSIVYSDKFKENLLKKKLDNQFINNTLRVNATLAQNMKDKLKPYGLQVSTLFILSGLQYRDNLISSMSYSDFALSRSLFGSIDTHKDQRVQFKTSPIVREISENILEFNLSEMCELLFLHELFISEQ